MQQLSRICMIADHDFKQIEYACMFPECTLSKLICRKCLKMGNHKHEQNNQSHILDNKELYEVLQEKLNKMQKGQSMNTQKGDKLQASPLKQLIQKIQESLKISPMQLNKWNKLNIKVKMANSLMSCY